MAGKEMAEVSGLCPYCSYVLPEHRWDCKTNLVPGLLSSTLNTAGKEMPPATAAKYGKLRVWEGLMERFPLALREVAKVSEFGAKKHQVAPENMSYRDVPEAYRVYTNGVGRHLIGEAVEGPVNLDPEDGGMLHPAQLAWNALARLEVYLRREGKGTK